MLQAIAGLWRWRGNPLCRRSDRVEAALSLCTALLIALGMPIVGWAAGTATQAILMEKAREQHHHRHPVWATVDRIVPKRPTAPDPDADTDRDGVLRVVAVWPSKDGSTRTGMIDTEARVGPGDRLRVWTDRRGEIAARPMSATTVSSQALLAGLAASGAVAVLVEMGRRFAVRQLLLARYAHLDQEWSRIRRDPGWNSELGPV